jgi:hypothetical protein
MRISLAFSCASCLMNRTICSIWRWTCGLFVFLGEGARGIVVRRGRRCWRCRARAGARPDDERAFGRIAVGKRHASERRGADAPRRSTRGRGSRTPVGERRSPLLAPSRPGARARDRRRGLFARGLFQSKNAPRPRSWRPQLLRRESGPASEGLMHRSRAVGVVGGAGPSSCGGSAGERCERREVLEGLVSRARLANGCGVQVAGFASTVGSWVWRSRWRRA